MNFLAALSCYLDCVLFLIVCVLPSCTEDAYGIEPASKKSAKTAPQAIKVVYDRYGLPANLLDKLLRQRNVFEVRTILARTPRCAGDEEARLILVGACLAAKERFEDAVVEFDKVRHMDQASNSALCLAARAYAQTDDYPKAIEYAGIAIKRCNDYESYEVRARCFNADRRYAEAAADYEKAAQVCPRRATDFYVQAATVMLRADRPTQALVLVERAPLGKPGSVDGATLLTKALCLEKLCRWSDGVTVLTKAVAICKSAASTEEDVATLCLIHCIGERAKCYEKLGKKTEAAADRQAVEKLSSGVESDLIGKRR